MIQCASPFYSISNNLCLKTPAGSSFLYEADFSLIINYVIIKLLFFLLNSNLPFAKHYHFLIFLFKLWSINSGIENSIMNITEIYFLLIFTTFTWDYYFLYQTETSMSNILLQWRYIKFVAFLFFVIPVILFGKEARLMCYLNTHSTFFYFLDWSEARLSLEYLVWPDILPSARAGPLFSLFMAHGSF